LLHDATMTAVRAIATALPHLVDTTMFWSARGGGRSDLRAQAAPQRRRADAMRSRPRAELP
jgi:hypothetical protein